MDSYQELVDFYSNQKNEYNAISQDLSGVQSEIRSIADVSDMEQYYAVVNETEEDYAEMFNRYYGDDDSESTSSASGMGGQQSVKLSELLKAEEKLVALKDAEDEIEDLFEEEKTLESKLALYDEEKISDSLSDAEENLTESKEDYNEFKTEFTETYGNVTEKEEMEKSVEDALTSLEKSKLSLTKQESSYQTALLNAEQKKESTDSTASNAQKEYNLQKIELDQKVEDAQEQYDTLVEELEEIKAAIGNDGVVTASCSGIVSSLSIEAGDEISTGSGSSDAMSFGSSSSAVTLMTITDMSEVNVSISISEDDILDVYLDQEAIVEIASFPDEKFDAVVGSISVEGETFGAASVSYTVNISFANEAGYELYDGMSADVTLVQGSARDCLYINEQAVTTKDGKSTVLVKGADGNGVETQITTGFSDGQYIEILSGINEGDTILVQSALGAGADSGSTPDMGSFDMSNMPDMGDFDMSNMPDMGDFDMSNMPDMGSFNPGEMMQ